MLLGLQNIQVFMIQGKKRHFRSGNNKGHYKKGSEKYSEERSTLQVDHQEKKREKTSWRKVDRVNIQVMKFNLTCAQSVRRINESPKVIIKKMKC